MSCSVSVVIPAYNHSAFLAGTLQSVFEQHLRPVEVIVVDDGSTDRTGDVLRMYEARIRVLSQPNRGVAAARNAGAAAASGAVLAFLDADDVWFPTKLERQMARVALEPELGLVHCGVQEIDGGGRVLRTRLDGLEGWISREMLLFRRGVILGGGSAAIVPRAVFEHVGGFDEGLSTSADWDVHYRIACRYRVGFVPEALVGYRVHGGNMHRHVQVMARDMLKAYANAFSERDPELQRVRRLAYGRLHSMLAGSFFRAGEYSHFLRHALASVALQPERVGYFAGYPVRALRRRRSASRGG